MAHQYYVMSEDEKKELIADAIKLKGSILERARILYPRYKCSMRSIQTTIAPHVPGRTRNIKFNQGEDIKIIELFNKSEHTIFAHKVKEVVRLTGRSFSLIRNVVLEKEKDKSTKLFDHKQEMF